jgi:murein DD-endopeptidase MepM/ murein hydrolase activator NlpD
MIDKKTVNSSFKLSFHSVQGSNLHICLLSALLLLSLLSGCKSARKISSSKTATGDINTVNIVFDADDGVASPENVAEQPKAVSQPVVGINSRHPAPEHYGSDWNTEHIRYSSAAKPSGTVVLDMLPDNANRFKMPVCGKVLSEFGPRNGRMHTGIDLKLELGDPVYCAFDGMVRIAKTYGDYGKMVVVRHHNGLETVYAHLSSISVKVNRQVEAGDIIGKGGRTGRATGVHLHFETRFKGEPFNPRLVINAEKCILSTQKLTLNKSSYKQYYKNPQMLITGNNLPAGNSEKADAGEKQGVSESIVVQTEHTVIKGDTLYNISRRYGLTVDSLRQINNLPENSILQIGQKLKIIP